ncbi:hypothetical protein I6N90_14820 [Paenibacillus sp. GSMTC-2017]|uniref:hypothetical protein n=1 Tax=Paenibacillus sp. GSMTC-2017 TaxID=2794350 RepID=UPI0018D7E715|nr:hypothetical protein [Paenibacillus sp. GSMTC-2017]MBH5319077.1 hypothetical protein [Paenibacillus sp. GSMTC-2017]
MLKRMIALILFMTIMINGSSIHGELYPLPPAYLKRIFKVRVLRKLGKRKSTESARVLMGHRMDVGGQYLYPFYW